jgi:hypothetical protein
MKLRPRAHIVTDAHRPHSQKRLSDVKRNDEIELTYIMRSFDDTGDRQ